MAEQSSTTLQLSIAMTTIGMMQITDENTTSSSSSSLSSSSHRTGFYFRCAYLVVGVVGTATNALILYAMVASKQQKKHVLIVNQNALDLFTCSMIVITNSLKLCNVHLSGSVGYWLCTLLLSECLVWIGTFGSVINLASITVERYLIVFGKKPRSWMTYAAVAVAWIVSFVYNVAGVFPTTAVIQGRCYAFAIGMTATTRILSFVANFVSFYVVVLFIFIFCYWRILTVIRRQAKVMAGHDAAGPNAAAAQAHYNQIQSNVVKTMIFVSAFYAVSYLPSYTYYLYLLLDPYVRPDGLYASVFVTYLYTCSNPFVYATQFSPVKQVLVRLIRCKKTSE